jgi:hypothetical protein
MFSVLLQLTILVTGVGAVWLLGRKSQKIRVIACWVGLISQLFWLIMFVQDGRQVMYITVAAYVVIWIDNLIHNKRELRNEQSRAGVEKTVRPLRSTREAE